jgi:hypothetical protein
MLIIGCDFHPSFQVIVFMDTESGEQQKRRLNHPAEAEWFYRSLAGKAVRVGIEATGNFRWFRRLVAEPTLSYMGHLRERGTVEFESEWTGTKIARTSVLVALSAREFFLSQVST